MKGLCHHCDRHYQRLDRHNKRFHIENKPLAGKTCSIGKQDYSMSKSENLALFLRTNDEKHMKIWLKKKSSKKSLLQLLDTLKCAQTRYKETKLSSGNSSKAFNSHDTINKLASPIFKWVHKLMKKFRSVLLQHSSSLYNLLKIL